MVKHATRGQVWHGAKMQLLLRDPNWAVKNKNATVHCHLMKQISKRCYQSCYDICPLCGHVNIDRHLFWWSFEICNKWLYTLVK